MKMEWAEAGTMGQLGKFGLFGMMSIQKTDHVCHSFVIIHDYILSSGKASAHPVLAAIFNLSLISN